MRKKKEVSYVMVKPEFANNEFVVLEIRKRLRDAGLKILDASYVYYDKDAARKHYAEHINKGFYQGLEDYITSGKAYGMIVEGKNAISVIRNLVQKDKKIGLQEGDIRYDIPTIYNFPIDTTKNVVHASDCEESAKHEILIYRELKEKYTTSKNDKENE